GDDGLPCDVAVARLHLYCLRLWLHRRPGGSGVIAPIAGATTLDHARLWLFELQQAPAIRDKKIEIVGCGRAACKRLRSCRPPRPCRTSSSCDGCAAGGDFGPVLV